MQGNFRRSPPTNAINTVRIAIRRAPKFVGIEADLRSGHQPGGWQRCFAGPDSDFGTWDGYDEITNREAFGHVVWVGPKHEIPGGKVLNTAKTEHNFFDFRTNTRLRYCSFSSQQCAHSR